MLPGDCCLQQLAGSSLSLTAFCAALGSQIVRNGVALGSPTCEDLCVHLLAGFRPGRTRAIRLALGVAALVVLGLPLLAAGAVHAARRPDTHRRLPAQKTSVCRIPRLTGLVLSVARERAAKAGCSIRLAGAHVEAPGVQTIRRQAPHGGRHGRFVTVWVNPVCSGSALEGSGISEPLITAGPTELISGLYIVGGPHRLWSEPRCAPRPGEPGAGTITVRDPANGAIVASQTMTRGHLATIPLAPGTYTIQGTFGDATINGQQGESFPQTVEIPPGKTVRQDVFLNVP